MSIDLIVTLFENDARRHRSVLARQLGAALKPMVANGLLHQADDIRFCDCRRCSEPHSVELRRVADRDRWLLDCPEFGFVTLESFDPSALKLNPHRFAECAFQALCELPNATARERFAGHVWEAWFDGRPMARPVFLARRLGEFRVLEALTAIIHRLPGSTTPIVLVTAAIPNVEGLLNANIVEVERELRLTEDGRIEAIRDGGPLATAKKRSGRRNKCARALALHESRRTRGEACKSNKEEAFALRALLVEEGVPASDLPKAKTIENQLSAYNLPRRKS